MKAFTLEAQFQSCYCATRSILSKESPQTISKIMIKHSSVLGGPQDSIEKS